MMYGKIFASMYEGSMVGSGPVVFAVWGYCIAKADIDGTVLLNPALLAPIIGTSRGEIESAIAFLQEPDGHSKNPEHEGRRLLHQTGHLFFLVSHEYYRAMKNNEERREYMREYMRKKRESDNVNVNKVNEVLTKVNPASASAYTSASIEGGCKGGEPTGFDRFWKAYPNRKGKKLAARAFAKAKDKPPIDELIAEIELQCKSEEWRKDGGQFIPHPATWLNRGGWEDEVTVKE
jgi:hypothetical protein